MKVRYRQTIIGAAWALLQPFLLMLVFTVFLGILSGIQSGSIPYPVFVFTGLVIWGAASKTMSEGTSSVIAEGGLIQQVYFPRIYCPISAAMGSVVDLLFGLVALLVLVAFFHVAPSEGVLLLPLFAAIAYAASLGLAMWLSGLYVAYRDVGHLLPFILQIWMFLSPVVYPTTLVPAEFQTLYSINPMVAAMDGFRWAFAGGPPPSFQEVTIGAMVATTLLVSGYMSFRFREPTFADLV